MAPAVSVAVATSTTCVRQVPILSATFGWRWCCHPLAFCKCGAFEICPCISAVGECLEWGIAVMLQVGRIRLVSIFLLPRTCYFLCSQGQAVSLQLTKCTCCAAACMVRDCSCIVLQMREKRAKLCMPYRPRLQPTIVLCTGNAPAALSSC